jgi:hypothetical protein
MQHVNTQNSTCPSVDNIENGGDYFSNNVGILLTELRGGSSTLRNAFYNWKDAYTRITNPYSLVKVANSVRGRVLSLTPEEFALAQSFTALVDISSHRMGAVIMNVQDTATELDLGKQFLCVICTCIEQPLASLALIKPTV